MFNRCTKYPSSLVENLIRLDQVYNLFRQLGLRHLFVVPRPSRVIGLITRKDLLIEVSILLHQYTTVLLTKSDIGITMAMLLVRYAGKRGIISSGTPTVN